MRVNPFCGHLFERTLVSALLVAALVPTFIFAKGEPDDLFQKALVQESAERNLEAAIALYQQTVGNPLVGPGVAAEARWRMGQCYEKLGKPHKAEMVYRQLLEKTSGVTPQLVQKARAHLRQVEAENRLKASPGSPGKVVWVRRFQLTPLSFLLGPSLSTGSNTLPVSSLMTGLRWRMSAADHPQRFYAQMRGWVPLSGSTVQNQVSPSNISGTTNATLNLQYQLSLGLVGELPHGRQRTVIPEVGAGFAVTATKISFANAAFSGDQSEKRWRPYLEAGLQLFPDRTLSLLINATYVQTPYPQSIDAQGIAGSQSFGFPSSQWVLGAMLQTKFGYYRSVPELQK